MSRIVLALRTNMAEESGVTLLREVSFNLRIGSHKKVSCATLKCETNFNEGQRRNELYDRLNMEQVQDKSIDFRDHGGTKNRQHEFDVFCRVLKLLLEHGTY